jgi:hypothetical protein
VGNGKQGGHIRCARTGAYDCDSAITGGAVLCDEYTQSESLRVGLLRKQILLRDIAPAHGADFAAIVENKF